MPRDEPRVINSLTQKRLFACPVLLWKTCAAVIPRNMGGRVVEGGGLVMTGSVNGGTVNVRGEGVGGVMVIVGGV